jgi:NAD(P)H dehydrogenase (quinone)
MKISVIYHSVSGNTQQVAELVAEGARLGGEVEAKSMNIDEVDEAFVIDSKAVIIGCPTHRGALSWQMKKWIETTRLKPAGKIGSVFVTEGYIGGGGDFAEMELIAHLLVMGALVYSGGTAWGQPYIHYGAIVIKDGDNAQRERAGLLGERVAKKALELFGNG